MADTKSRLSFKDVRASIKRIQAEGEKLVTRVRRDVRSFAAQSRREAVSSLLADARKLQNDLRKRAERAMKEIEHQRTRILASFEEQVVSLVEGLVKRFNVATETEITELRRRVAEIERRLDTLSKEKAA